MRSSLTLLFTLIFSSILFAQNGQKNFIDQPYIEVTGQAEIEIIPTKFMLVLFLVKMTKKAV